MAEWLGTGLQNLLQQFESAWYLNPRSTSQRVAPFSLIVFTAFYCPLLYIFVHGCTSAVIHTSISRTMEEKSTTAPLDSTLTTSPDMVIGNESKLSNKTSSIDFITDLNEIAAPFKGNRVKP